MTNACRGVFLNLLCDITGVHELSVNNLWQVIDPTECSGLHHQADIILDLCPYATAANSRLPWAANDRPRKRHIAAEGWVPPSNTHQPSFHQCCIGKQLTVHRFKWPFHISFHELRSLGNGGFKMSITVLGGKKRHQRNSIICACMSSLFSLNVKFRKHCLYKR